MKEFKYILTIICIQNSLCTIDISIQTYEYLSNHLTPEECRRLYASLHFVSYNLPSACSAVEKKVPLDERCLKLLLKWDKQKEKWGGQAKSHVDIGRRLRQIGRNDLAEWLSRNVFNQLTKDVGSSLEMNFKNKTQPVKAKKHKENKAPGLEWTAIDSILWMITSSLFVTTVYILLRVLFIWCSRRIMKKKARQEEIKELLSFGSIDSDQETIYECVLSNNISRDKIEDNDDR